MKITAKLILTVAHHGWMSKKKFPLLAVKDLTEKHQICILYYRTLEKELLY